MTLHGVQAVAPPAEPVARSFDEAAAAQRERFAEVFGRLDRERNEALRE